MPTVDVFALSTRVRLVKRTFDVSFALLGLMLTSWLIVVAWIASAVEIGWGLYRQERVGLQGRIFTIYKIRTMRESSNGSTTVTIARDPRITRVGRALRRAKLDELPQLVNVLLGDMSFVGPRPDVPGFADRLEGADRLILAVRPGITGPATLRFRDEEELLAQQPDPERFNREVLYPEKVRLNLEYIRNYRFRDDLLYIWRTIFGS